jgi:hypothetical protein
MEKINTLEEIEILLPSPSLLQTPDVTARQTDPNYKLLPSLCDLNSNDQQPRPSNKRNFETQQLNNQ